jgi:hypothetical protein
MSNQMRHEKPNRLVKYKGSEIEILLTSTVVQAKCTH